MQLVNVTIKILNEVDFAEILNEVS